MKKLFLLLILVCSTLNIFSQYSTKYFVSINKQKSVSSGLPYYDLIDTVVFPTNATKISVNRIVGNSVNVTSTTNLLASITPICFINDSLSTLLPQTDLNSADHFSTLVMKGSNILSTYTDINKNYYATPTKRLLILKSRCYNTGVTAANLVIIYSYIINGTYQ